MGFWRLIITIIITLAIMVFILLSFPTARAILPQSERLPVLPDLGSLFGGEKEEVVIYGDISFSFESSEYDGAITTQAENITIILETTNTNFDLGVGTIDGNKKITIEGYSGFIEINNNELSLDGSFGKLTLDDLDVTFKNNIIKGDTEINNLVLRDVYIPLIDLNNAKGNLNVRNLNIEVNDQKITLTAFKGILLIKESSLTIGGLANSISIPNSDIEIK